MARAASLRRTLETCGEIARFGAERHEIGAVAHTVPVDRIRHKAVFRIAHRQRPERMSGRKLTCWEVHDVVVLTVQCVSSAIFARRPIHRFLWDVYWAKKYNVARGSPQYVIARFAASEHDSPAVDLRDIGVPDNQ